MRTTAMWLLVGVLALLGGQPSVAGTGNHAPQTARVGASAPAERTSRPTVVALGDSFSSGAGIGMVEARTGCQRSDRNYLRLVARRLDAVARDATCGSATTDDATRPQHTGANGSGYVPPQLDAVRRPSDVVLISLGLNDLRFFYDMVFECVGMRGLFPTGRPCEAKWRLTLRPGPIERLPAIGARLTAVVEAAQRRAPAAKVMVVGYPQLVPASGTCPDLPLPTGEYAYFHEAFAQLAVTMSRVASSTGTTYVDVLGPSEGHDICAGGHAWVNGRVNKPGVALSYHPYAKEQRAIARLILQHLQR